MLHVQKAEGSFINKKIRFTNNLCELSYDFTNNLVNFYIVSKPVEVWDLGIGNLRLRNEASLAKWL